MIDTQTIGMPDTSVIFQIVLPEPNYSASIEELGKNQKNILLPTVKKEYMHKFNEKFSILLVACANSNVNKTVGIIEREFKWVQNILEQYMLDHNNVFDCEQALINFSNYQIDCIGRFNDLIRRFEKCPPIDETLKRGEFNNLSKYCQSHENCPRGCDLEIIAESLVAKKQHYLIDYLVILLTLDMLWANIAPFTNNIKGFTIKNMCKRS